MELTLAEVVTGVRRTVEMRMPVECETCGGSGGQPGTHPTRCAHLRRRGRGAPGPALAARPDRDRGPVPEVRGPRHHDRPPVRHVPGRRPGRRHALDRRRGPGGHRRRAAPAARGSRPGRAARRRRRRPLRRGARRPQRALRAARRRPLAPAARSRSCRPRSARGFALETFDGSREIDVQSGTQPGARIRLPGLGVPSLRNGRRGDLVVEVDVQVPTNLTPSRPSCSRSSRSSAAKRSRRRTRACSRASGRPSGRDDRATGGRSAPRGPAEVAAADVGGGRGRRRAHLRRRPRRPVEITGADGHHLQRVRRLRAGEHVTVADGAGAWRRYEIEAVEPGRLQLGARGDRVVEPELVPRVVARGRAHQGGRARHRRRALHRARRRRGSCRSGPGAASCGGTTAQAERAVERLRVIAREAAAQSPAGAASGDRRRRRPRRRRRGRAGVGGRRPRRSAGARVVGSRRGSRNRDCRHLESWSVVGPEGGLDPAELDRAANMHRVSASDRTF